MMSFFGKRRLGSDGGSGGGGGGGKRKRQSFVDERKGELRKVVGDEPSDNSLTGLLREASYSVNQAVRLATPIN